ncbi:kinase-like protein [Cucurbitaria berberidis CBS 394.84]|uniref:Kinase-like protein n=1 Tax=Cucurbitaria berberidis CBS 394.84 TaxID=1168544 RepID=A0A9P4GHB4_9PLEO|nr:kinase-like protein [Cucurbitaria berberidis CBS 394.84]KAF1845216.1 kinase-like protein [Cucurbitaria berberidis CBS 394.84]
MATPYQPSCESARERLVIRQVTPQSKHLPRGKTSYFPRSAIVDVLKEFPVQDIFTCNCARCRHYAGLQGGLDDRRQRCSDRELLGKYATIYALLIYLRYPSLISIFLRQEVSLDKGYLSRRDLRVLDQYHVLTDRQKQIIRQEVLETQHRFRVRHFIKRNEITDVDEQEILPIVERSTPIGKGDFGEVYAFELPDEYVDDDLKKLQIKSFARKIFDRRWTQADTAKEWVNHLYTNSLKHQNLMEALAAFEYGDYFFIVFQLAQTTLWRFLKDDAGGVTFTSQELWGQVQGLASGLAYLHGQNVTGNRWENGKMYHMDLKPSNILIVNGIMKISDFGLSRYKPDPNPSESRLIGDSRQDGAGVYAPPPGRVDEGWDVYSLGAILSEIASFDIGKTVRVEQYRRERGSDTLNGQRYGSIHFYYSETFNLKQSVVQEHYDLLQEVESRGAPDDIDPPSWQEQFYHQGLFENIEKMLHQSTDERPKASKVADELDMRIRQAARVARGSQPRKIDIWNHTIQGTVISKPEPPREAYRMIAYLEETPCGLWLYPDDKVAIVKVRRFIYDERFQELVIEVDRKRPRSTRVIKPLYVNSANSCQLSFTHSDTETADLYRFPDLSGALHFQSIMTGEHVYRSMSLELTKFAFLRKEMFGFLGRGANREKYYEHQDVAGPAHLQIWTNCDLADENNAPSSLDVTIAIITETQLDLVKFTNPKGLKTPIERANTIQLVNSIDMACIKTPNGMPLTLKGIEKFRNYAENKHEGVRFYLKDEADVAIFWENLTSLHKRWVELYPVFFAPPAAMAAPGIT